MSALKGCSYLLTLMLKLTMIEVTTSTTTTTTTTKTCVDSAKLAAWYDFQAPIYHFWRDNYAHPLVSRVVNLLNGKKSQRVLDAACGSGLFSIGMALCRPDWFIEGVDCSNGLLNIARKQAGKRSLSNACFHHGDVQALAYNDEEFTAVVTAGLFPNLNEPHRALGEMYRVLEANGRLIVVEFDRSSMNCGTRCFFRLMISGYRFFSTIFPRFRFAEKWDIESSTTDEKSFLVTLQQAGFAVEAVLHEHQHLIFLCRKPEMQCHIL